MLKDRPLSSLPSDTLVEKSCPRAVEVFKLIFVPESDTNDFTLTAGSLVAIAKACGQKVYSYVHSQISADLERQVSHNGASSRPPCEPSFVFNGRAATSEEVEVALMVLDNVRTISQKREGTTTQEMMHTVQIARAVSMGCFDGGTKVPTSKLARCLNNHRNVLGNVQRKFARAAAIPDIREDMRQETSRKRKRGVEWSPWNEHQLRLAQLSRISQRKPHSNMLPANVRKAVIQFWNDGRWTIESPCKRDQKYADVDGVRRKVSARLDLTIIFIVIYISTVDSKGACMGTEESTQSKVANNCELSKVGMWPPFSQVPKRFYEGSLACMLDKFKSLPGHGDMEISETMFWKLKPRNIVPLKINQLSTCTCIIHQNSSRALKAMKDMRRKILGACETCAGSPNPSCPNPSHAQLCDMDTFNSLHKTWELALCPKPEGSEYHRADCIFGRCATCGTRESLTSCSLFRWLEEEVDESAGQAYQTQVSYFGKMDIIGSDGQPVRDEEGKIKTKVGLIQKEMGPNQLAKHFHNLVLLKLPPHQFRALWQWQQFQSMREELPLGQAVVVMDFSENHALICDGEVQSCHWTTNYCSLHIAIVWRHAVHSVDGVDSTVDNPVIVKDIFDFVSEDVTHDMHFVFECQRRMYVDYYQTELGLSPFECVHEWTDGCAAQYKCSNVFGDMANSWKDAFGMPIHRNFFEVLSSCSYNEISDCIYSCIHV